MNAAYRFGRFELRPGSRQLLQDGKPLAIGSRAFDLLLCLVERQERVVTKDEMLATAWPGVVVEENNLTVQVSALRKVLGPDALATVPGRGYRFALPVDQSQQERSRGGGPTIAVIPFVLMAADAGLQFLADSLVEDVTALLARIPGFTVISRSSSFTFRGSMAGATEVAAQLGVRYLVEGSVRASATRVRLSAELVEAESGQVLWSGRFECGRSEVVDLQDDIARGVLSELEPQLTRAEIARIERQRPGNLDAWDCYRRGLGVLGDLGLTENSLRRVLEHFEQAIAADPSFGLAYAHHALYSSVGARVCLLPDGARRRADVVSHAQRALELDPGSPEVLGYAGCALVETGVCGLGMEFLRHAVALDPSNAQARVALGAGLCSSGELDSGIALLRSGMALSPRDRRQAFWSWALSGFLDTAERRSEALHEARQSQRHDPRLFLGPLAEAAVLMQEDRVQEALMALSSARRLRPSLVPEELAQIQGERAARLLQPLWVEGGN
jgi:TolB-like protein